MDLGLNGKRPALGMSGGGGGRGRIMVIVEVITPPLFMIVILCKPTSRGAGSRASWRNVTRRNKKLRAPRN